MRPAVVTGPDVDEVHRLWADMGLSKRAWSPFAVSGAAASGLIGPGGRETSWGGSVGRGALLGAGVVLVLVLRAT